MTHRLKKKKNSELKRNLNPTHPKLCMKKLFEFPKKEKKKHS